MTNPESQITTPETDDDQLAISVRGLTNRFGSQVVHEELDLDVRRGEILGVVGGSGTGKSVLMRSILGLREPDAGSIRCLARMRARAVSSIASTSPATPVCCFRTARCFPR